MEPRKWSMDVGAVTARTASLFSGTPPAVMRWPTLNIGPEMAGMAGVQAVWETAEIDVLIEEGSQ